MADPIQKKQKRSERVYWGDVFRRLVVAWLAAATVEYLLLPEELRGLGDMGGLVQMSLLRELVVCAVLYAALWIAGEKWNTAKAERWALVCLFGTLVLLTNGVPMSVAFALACLFMLGLLVAFARGGRSLEKPVWTEDRLCLGVTAVLAGLFFWFVGNWTVSRLRAFCNSTYDFGIFAQMFHYMKTTGLPLTTLERDGLLSHFHVHMSPIYYLMLPVYCLAPEPETLQLLQAAVMASAVIPLWLLSREHGMRPVERMLVCALLLVLPAFAGGASYDLHENCFLTPLLLWLFYGIRRKNGRITVISFLLTLMVKEDAAVYCAVVALWLILRTLLGDEDKKWGLFWGGVMLFWSVMWFLLVTWYLQNVGDGVMSGRYENFLYDGSGSLLSVIKAVILNPMKLLWECVEEEKLRYITYTMVPLLGLPLFTRKYERLVLLIPYVLVNLMPDYTYQHDIFFQYSFGSTACLVALTVMNLADWKGEWKRIAALAAALIVAAMCFGKEVLPRGIQYPTYCEDYRERYDTMRLELDKIPDDASVAATTFLTPYLSQRDALYDLRYTSWDHVMECDYIAMNRNDTGSLRLYAENEENGYENLVRRLAENGYQLFTANGSLEIYWRIE